jgi:hypothetical protein
MLMGQIPGSISVPVTLVMVAIVAAFAQRTWGLKGLLWVWLGSTVSIVGVHVFWMVSNYGLPPLPQALLVVAIVVALEVIMVTLASGAVILCVASFVSPPKHASSPEVNYFPFNLPMGKLEDTDGLAGILRKYHELLSTFATALDSALGLTPFNPYLRQPRAFFRGFRSHLPSYIRQARVSSRQFDLVPNALMRDLASADAVLVELEALTPAQLSAIEECHRVNTRRVRRRSLTIGPIIEWSEKSKLLAVVVVAVLGSLGVGKVDDLWPLMRGITFTWAIPQSNIIIYGVVMFLMFLIFLLMNLMTFRPVLRRLQAFEDILTIAKAYRKGLSETTKPSAGASLTAID